MRVCMRLYTNNNYVKLSLYSHAGLGTCMLNNHKVPEHKLFVHTDTHTRITSTNGLFRCHVLTQIRSNFNHKSNENATPLSLSLNFLS